jgi:hypothetical protein
MLPVSADEASIKEMSAANHALMAVLTLSLFFMRLSRSRARLGNRWLMTSAAHLLSEPESFCFFLP